MKIWGRFLSEAPEGQAGPLKPSARLVSGASSRGDDEGQAAAAAGGRRQGGDGAEHPLAAAPPLLCWGCLWGRCDQGTGVGSGSGLGTSGIRPTGSVHSVGGIRMPQRTESAGASPPDVEEGTARQLWGPPAARGGPYSQPALSTCARFHCAAKGGGELQLRPPTTGRGRGGGTVPAALHPCSVWMAESSPGGHWPEGPEPHSPADDRLRGARRPSGTAEEAPGPALCACRGPPASPSDGLFAPVASASS